MKKTFVKLSILAVMTAALSVSAIAAETESVKESATENITETFSEDCSVYNYADDYVEKVAVDGNPVMNVVGPWQDQTSQRAVMSIACEGENGAVVVIDWADNAYTLTRWVLHGIMDDKGVITYKNGIKMKIVSRADGAEASTEELSEAEGTIEEYMDGEGTIVQNEDGTLTWNDKKENVGEGCVFVFNTPCPSTVGIEDEPLSGGWMRAEPSEITEEIKAVLDKAKENFEGSEIEPIAYLGSQDVLESTDVNELESANDGKETFTQVIMFTSNFHSPKEESGAWNPDEEYTDWQWWLARSDGGEWKLMTWGY